MQTIKTEKQTELVNALLKNPAKKSIPVSSHLKGLKKILKSFQQEIDLNIMNFLTAKEIMDYLSKVNILFLDSLMFYEGSFELLLFPEDIDDCPEKKQRITNFNKAHLLIYKMALKFIRKDAPVGQKPKRNSGKNA